jgi:uncharacterized protein involved in type VI secretion and phage assembly
MAGAERGTYFLPEEGDEVLVAFENGDINYPYVLGGLWNGGAPPPETNDGANDVRTVHSRSGHELRFDDADDGGVELTTSAGHRVTLEDGSGGGVTIEAGDSGSTIELDANGGVTLTAGSELSISAPTIELSGQGNVTVEASGVLTLKGAVIQLN